WKFNNLLQIRGLNSSNKFLWTILLILSMAFHSSISTAIQFILIQYCHISSLKYKTETLNIFCTSIKTSLEKESMKKLIPNTRHHGIQLLTITTTSIYMNPMANIKHDHNEPPSPLPTNPMLSHLFPNTSDPKIFPKNNPSTKILSSKDIIRENSIHNKDNNFSSSASHQSNCSPSSSCSQTTITNPLPKRTRNTSGNYDINSESQEEHTSELQSRENLVCRLLLE